MAANRYSIPENLRGSTFHTKELGAIKINDSTTQKELKHLREVIGVQDIQVSEKSMSLGEEIKVMEKDLEVLKVKQAKENKSK